MLTQQSETRIAPAVFNRIPVRTWTSTEDYRPPRGRVVETIVDLDGERRFCRLQLGPGPLWFLESGRLYVHAVPTHWRDCEA